MNVKTIDVSDMNVKTVKVLLTSLKETGFAVLKNHGLDPELQNRVYSQWKQYFAQPDEVKLQDFHQEKHEGYFPLKSENAKDYSLKDIKEFYHVYHDTKLPYACSAGRKKEMSPTHLLMNNLEMLGFGILGLIGGEDYVRMAYDSPNTLFRILHYPPVGNADTNSGAVRSAAHEDVCLLTLLPAATQPGLEIKDNDGTWHAIKCDPGTIVINCGDMLQELSSGVYKSTTHRVVNPVGENVSRYSMPLFVHAHPETRLSERYTAKEYLDERLKELGLK